VIDADLAMLYSPLHGHQPIKHLPIEMPSKNAYASFTPDSETLAIIGDSSTHVDLWNTSSLQLIGKIFVGKTLTKVVFSQNGDLWCVFEDCSVRRYNIDKLTIEVEMTALHRGSIKGIAFDISHHILYTIGEDSLLKLWDYSFQR
jgi:WD40 repeat protein